MYEREDMLGDNVLSEWQLNKIWKVVYVVKKKYHDQADWSQNRFVQKLILGPPGIRQSKSQRKKDTKKLLM